MLLLGIQEGILLAALISVLLLIARSSTPHVAFLGRIPGTTQYSDLQRHPDNEPLIGVLADKMGIHQSFIIPIICYLFIAFYGFVGHKPTRTITA